MVRTIFEVQYQGCCFILFSLRDNLKKMNRMSSCTLSFQTTRHFSERTDPISTTSGCEQGKTFFWVLLFTSIYPGDQRKPLSQNSCILSTNIFLPNPPSPWISVRNEIIGRMHRDGTVFLRHNPCFNPSTWRKTKRGVHLKKDKAGSCLKFG